MGITTSVFNDWEFLCMARYTPASQMHYGGVAAVFSTETWASIPANLADWPKSQECHVSEHAPASTCGE